ncbi:hypothetical protein E4191_03500 [Paracoccus liaowanqingii]|uniref:Uncharacterized protein n=1 Tax=Paracoccus liaowanqingii TaxID=2560053 RepID=A0A4P7HIH8_9RHOB|nr:hypothetical protein [Paracoccus liaowanqingii]QBX33884.1 hypothetical protein E4191_03500 [Paracoccus liaowanqingii]
MKVDQNLARLANLSKPERVAHSYTTRVLPLTLLSPSVVEVILDGRQGPELTLPRMLEPFPADWAVQLSHWRAALR